MTLDESSDMLDGDDGIDQLEFLDLHPLQPIVMTGDLQAGFTIMFGGERAATGRNFEALSGWGSSGDDKFLGGSGEDAISVGEGRDVVRTFGGDDYVSVELDRGLDRIDLGAGIDRVVLKEASGADVVMSEGRGVVFVARDGRDAAQISGAERFLVAGGDGDDRLQGGASTDVLLGGSGRNVLRGAEGDDGLAVALDGSRDRVFGGAGDDALVIEPAFRFADDSDEGLVTEVTDEGDFRISLDGRILLQARSVERVEISDGSGADLLIGQSMADILRSTINADTLIGGAGDDTLIGGEGAARMVGGKGRDTADLSGFSSSLDFELALDSQGTATPLRLFDGDPFARLVGIENVIGGRGDDSIAGDAFDNVIEGFEGSDTLDGGGGVDTLSFASFLNVGVKVRLAGSAEAIVRETDSPGEMEFRDVIRNFENVLGGRGDDFIAGDDGNNRLMGGTGLDTLTGGGGADTFLFGEESSTNDVEDFDRVRDFSSAQGDRLDLTAIAARSANATPGALALLGQDAFTGAGGELRYAFGGGDTQVSIDLNGDRETDQTIVLNGRINLAETDFILT